MNTDELREKVASFPYWYHHIKLTDEVTTPGFAPIQMEAYRVPLDLTGKRILDVGAWDGFWTFEALKRGASEVVAIDDFSDDLTPDKSRRATGWQQFDLCRDVLDWGDQCRRQELNLYELKPETFGAFDIVFCFGLLYHCRYPLAALDRLGAVCSDTIYIESAVCDHFSPYQAHKHPETGGYANTYAGDHVVMEFYPGSEYGGQPTNWWVPSLQCLLGMTQAAGFPYTIGWELTPKPDAVALCRSFVRGMKRNPADG